MAQQVRHELQLLADTHNALDFKSVFLRKADKTFLGPERLVVDIENAKRMFAFVRLKVAEIPRNNNLENILDTDKVWERQQDMSLRSQVILAKID